MRKLLTGNEACLEGGIAAGMRFFAGYPITPSTEVAEAAAERLPEVGGKFIQMEDEIAGMATTIGGAVAGFKAMTATSGPGFSLKVENIGYAAIAEIPCVIVNVQRLGPSTGLPTSPSQADVMQAKWGSQGDYPMIALAPSSVQETYEVTIKAFNLAEKYRTPVVILMDEVVGHMREVADIPDTPTMEIIERKRPTCKPEEYKPYADPAPGEIIAPLAGFGEGYRFNITGLIHDELGFPTNNIAIAGTMMDRVIRKVTDNRKDIVEYGGYEEIDVEGCDVLVMTFGCTARTVTAAKKLADEKGIKMGIFRIITIWPFPGEELKECVNKHKIKNVLVAELNNGQLSLEAERVLKTDARVWHIGKIDGDILYPGEVLNKVSEVIKNG